MKNLKLILIASFLFSGSLMLAQQTDSLILHYDAESDAILYQDVVEAEGSPTELFYRSITWMNEHWDNARGMIKKQDKMNGLLEAHVRFDIKKVNEKGVPQKLGRLVYVLRLEFKDGRYRYTITDFNLLKKSIYPLNRWMDPENQYYDQRNEEILRIIAQEIEHVIESMKKGMEKEEEKTNDDW